MDTIRMIGMSVCVTAAVTAIFSMLAPSSNYDRVLKFAVSLFFLTSLVAPFAGGDFQFQFDFSSPMREEASAEQVSGQMERQFLSLAEKKLAAGLEKALAAEGITPKKVTAAINIGEDGGISISRLKILLPAGAEDLRGRTAETARRETGLAPEIFIESE